MELLAFGLDFVLHVDRHLANFVQLYGAWVYALLFVIIFVETGVVVMPFLPGDSLLFVVGAMCGIGLMNLPLTIALLSTAAVLGNQCNYTIGRWFGPKVFGWEQSLVQQGGFRQGACLLRGIRRHHDRHRALHALSAYLRALRRQRGGDDAAQVQLLRRERRHAVGRLAGHLRLPVRQPAVGQGQPVGDHLGADQSGPG